MLQLAWACRDVDGRTSHKQGYAMSSLMANFTSYGHTLRSDYRDYGLTEPLIQVDKLTPLYWTMYYSNKDYRLGKERSRCL